MEKFIPFEKLSKKRQRELNLKKRRDWGAISPVTRKPESEKIYKRKKTRINSDKSLYPGLILFPQNPREYIQYFLRLPLKSTAWSSRAKRISL